MAVFSECHHDDDFITLIASNNGTASGMSFNVQANFEHIRSRHISKDLGLFPRDRSLFDPKLTDDQVKMIIGEVVALGDKNPITGSKCRYTYDFNEVVGFCFGVKKRPIPVTKVTVICRSWFVVSAYPSR